MPETPIAQEAVAKAYVRENIPNNPTTESDRLASTLVENVDKEGYRSTLEIGAAPEVNHGKIDQKVEQIGAEYDPATDAIVRSPEGQARYTEATEHSKLAKKFLENGYDATGPRALSAAERAKIRSRVLIELKKRPALAEQYNKITSASEKEKFIDRHIRDPRFSEQLKTALETIAESEDLPDLVSDKQNMVNELEIERDARQREVDEVDKRITALQDKLDQFERRPTPTGTPTKGEELDQLVNDRTTIESAIASSQTDLEDQEALLRDLDQQRKAMLRNDPTSDTTDVDTKRGDARDAIRKAKEAITESQAKLAKIEQLKTEEETLTENMRGLVAEKGEKQVELDKANNVLNKNRGELREYQKTRANMEQDLVNRFGGVWGEAARELISEDINKLLDAAQPELDKQREEIEAKKTEAQAKKVGAVLDRIPQVLTKEVVKKRLGKTSVDRKIDKKRTIEFTDSILANGPGYATEAVMRGTINPETGVPFTQQEIHDLMEDPVIRSTLERQVVAQTLSRDIMIGDMTEDKVYQISNSRWGQGMIEQAMQINTEYRSNVEKVFGAGALEKPGFAKRFAREVGNNKNLWWLLLLPLGFGAVTAAGIAGTAAHEARQQGKLYA